jgi:sporulation protein YlmC with PRC-barrel domain
MKKLTMILSLTGASLLGAHAYAQSTAPAPAPTPPAVAMPDPIYTTPWTPAHWRASEVIGKPVYTRNDERIGEVDELLVGSDGRVVAAVVGVGGFLGMGERKVAISYPAIKFARDANGHLRANVEVGKDMLKGAPEYKPVKAM